MKTLTIPLLILCSLSSMASTEVKTANLDCKWSAFDSKREQFDGRDFKLTLQMSDDGEGMVYEDHLSKLGLESLEVQAIPQGATFTHTSPISLNFVLKQSCTGLIYQASGSSTLSGQIMSTMIQVGSFSSELVCKVIKITLKKDPQ